MGDIPASYVSLSEGNRCLWVKDLIPFAVKNLRHTQAQKPCPTKTGMEPETFTSFERNIAQSQTPWFIVIQKELELHHFFNGGSLSGFRHTRSKYAETIYASEDDAVDGRILRHLGCIKPCVIYHINWCRILFHQQ